jgi:hypothetical protein
MEAWERGLGDGEFKERGKGGRRTESQPGSKRKDSPEKVTENQAVPNKKHKVNPVENKSMPLAEQVSNKVAKEREV